MRSWQVAELLVITVSLTNVRLLGLPGRVLLLATAFVGRWLRFIRLYSYVLLCGVVLNAFWKSCRAAVPNPPRPAAVPNTTRPAAVPNTSRPAAVPNTPRPAAVPNTTRPAAVPDPPPPFPPAGGVANSLTLMDQTLSQGFQADGS